MTNIYHSGDDNDEYGDDDDDDGDEDALYNDEWIFNTML